jgi:hypothetical protein
VRWLEHQTGGALLNIRVYGTVREPGACSRDRCTRIESDQAGYSQVDGLAARSDDTLFGAVANGGGSNLGAVITINTATDAPTSVGSSGTSGINALAFSSGGTLYASCAIYSVNPERSAANDRQRRRPEKSRKPPVR